MRYALLSAAPAAVCGGGDRHKKCARRSQRRRRAARWAVLGHCPDNGHLFSYPLVWDMAVDTRRADCDQGSWWDIELESRVSPGS